MCILLTIKSSHYLDVCSIKICLYVVHVSIGLCISFFNGNLFSGKVISTETGFPHNPVFNEGNCPNPTDMFA